MHMLASTVSSKFIQSLSDIEGFQFEVRCNITDYCILSNRLWFALLGFALSLA